MSTLPHSFRIALRRLARAPLLVGLVLLTLGPGLGAHIAIFNLVDALFLRPLPVADAGSLVAVYQTRDGDGTFPLSLPDFADVRGAAASLSGLASHYPTAPLVPTGGGGAAEVNGSVVSANYFALLGVRPALGRFFLPEEDGAGAAGPVAVVSHRFWRSQLGGRPDAVGQVLRLNGTAFTVVGVAPPRFTGLLLGVPSNVWLTNAQAAAGYRWCDPRDRGCTWLSMVGRLRPGRSLAAAQAEMTALARRLEEAHPASDRGRGLRVVPLRGVHPSARTGTVRLAALLVAAVSLGVAVACANLVSLLLARSLARRRETAVRLALGATRVQVMAPVVAEALLLALAAGAIGVLLSPLLGHVVAALYPSDVPLDLPLRLPVLAYAAAVSLATGLLVGLAPGLRSTRSGPAPALREDAASWRRHGGGSRLPALLIVFQVALSLVLIAATGLLARSVAEAGASAGTGLDLTAVMTVRLRPRLIGAGAARAQAFSREAVRRLAGLPGVRAVSLAEMLPPALAGDPQPVRPADGPPPRPEDEPRAWVDRVGPHFFRTFGVPLLRGRDLDDRDSARAPRVAIVNRELARRLWPRTEPVGRRLAVGGQDFEVVGLVPDLGPRGARQGPAPQLYLAFWQDEQLIDSRLCVRAAGDPLALVPALLRELHAIDRGMPVTEVEPAGRNLDRLMAPARVSGGILGLSAVLALFLSASGLFGSLSLAVTRRTREIGIRLALGAGRGRVVGAVAGETALLVGVALVLGTLGAAAAGRLLAHQLDGVGPLDPPTLVAAVTVLALTAAAAGWLPARRTSRIDPAAALRSD